MTSITDIPLDDIKEFLIQNNIKIAPSKQETYNLAKDLILNSKAKFYSDSIIDWIIAYNFILSNKNIATYSLQQINSLSAKELTKLGKKLKLDNNEKQLIINILTYLHKINKFELLPDDIKFAELLPRLGLEDFLSFCATDSKHRKLCDNDNFWQYLWDEHYGEEKLINDSYKENFILAYQIEKLNKFLISRSDYFFYGYIMKGKNRIKSQINITFDLDNLQLTDYDLEELPKEVGYLVNLRQLLSTNNDFRFLPIEIGNLVNLWLLDLRNNELKSLPKEIGNLRNLKHLLLGKNKLTSIPEEIGNLFNLEMLFLYKNRLESLPKQIGNLINLERLDISKNRLTELPEEMVNLKKLTIFTRDEDMIENYEIMHAVDDITYENNR